MSEWNAMTYEGKNTILRVVGQFQARCRHCDRSVLVRSGVKLTGNGSPAFLSSPGATLDAQCDWNVANGGPSFFIIFVPGGTVSGTTVVWWNKDGTGVMPSLLNRGNWVTPAGGTTTPYTVVVQVDNVTSVSTFTATEWYDSASDTCHFAGQVVTTNG